MAKSLIYEAVDIVSVDLRSPAGDPLTIEFAQTDAAAMLDNDARVADEFDARTRLRDAGAG